MKKPVIVISPQTHEVKNLPFEMKMYATPEKNAWQLQQRGAIPVMPSFLSEEEAEQLMAMADGLFMTGGADVGPDLYGEEVQPFCGGIEKDRDVSDMNLLKAAAKLKKPIFSVCRGSQITNVFFGGKLYQDLNTQLGDMIKHPDYFTTKTEESHIVNIVEGSPLHKLLGKDSIGVNSTHHQGYKVLGEKLIPMAFAPDGLCESFYLDSDDHWVRCYQWHPEMQDFGENMDKILQDFVNACIDNMNK
ncbi:MAG: gamma-glutamyl-gamma-aminobutyrate hydrolase family protein [Oscillospiraceae bacterium]|nr:gamma-glutamyl-gamma-aminobutyrate hydrolase family protein [Oscillospiraceae bacterium]